MTVEYLNVDVLHDISVRLGSGDDSTKSSTGSSNLRPRWGNAIPFYLLLDGDELVLRGFQKPAFRSRRPLEIPRRRGNNPAGSGASRTRVHFRKSREDTRFQFFHELPEDSYEAFLSVPLMCRGRVVGVINLQHRQHHVYRRREIRMISAIGFLVGSEIELARLEEANSTLAEQLQTRKVVERAKGILQRDLGLNEEQAYLTLQRQSRQKRRPMKEIAEAIILSDEVRGNSPASLS